MKIKNAMILLLLAATIHLGNYSCAADKFDDVIAWIIRGRSSGDIKLNVRCSGDECRFFRESKTAIEAQGAETLLLSAGREADPHLKLVSGEEIKYFIISPDVKLEQHPAPLDGKSFWIKVEQVSIGAIAIDEWRQFLERAVNSGLSMYEDYRDGTNVIVQLSFRHIDSHRFTSAEQTIRFTDQFYDYLRMSPQNKAYVGNEGLVVLFHEPHGSVNGRFQSVPGLRTLISANQSNKFQFLVEGEFSGPSREIGFNSLDQKLDAARGDVPAENLVYTLLSRHAIDSPLAYRLLYDRHLPAIAIDNPRYLPKQPYGNTSVAGKVETMDAILGIIKAMEASHVKVSSAEQSKLNRVFLDGIRYVAAEAEDEHGTDYVEYLGKLAAKLIAIVESSDALVKQNPDISASRPIQFLRTQCEAYSNLQKEYAEALERNEMMSDFILKYAKSRNNRIPIAFIGSFHTEGITKRLRDEHVGYVVVEPRIQQVSSAAEQQNFEMFLYPVSRQRSLEKLKNLNKGPVSLTYEEVQEYVVPFLKNETERVKEREKLTKQLFSSATPKDFDLDEFTQSLRENGSLANANVESGGGGGSPPTQFTGAFAFFEPEGPGHSAKFVVLDPTDTGWSKKSRFNFLRACIMVIPGQVQSKILKTRVEFYQDHETSRMYASLFDINTRRSYLFEGEKALAILTQIQLPKPKADANVFIRMQLSDNLKKIMEEKNG